MSEKLETDRSVQVRAVLSFVIVLSIIAITGLGIFILVLNKRVAKQEERPRIIPAVESLQTTLQSHLVSISTQGVVESSRQTELAAEVRGLVVEISPNLKRGGTVTAGERLVQIAPADFRAALATAESMLADAEVALETERARSEQARLDWEKLGRGEPTNPLVLRGPQLAAAEASAASARAEVERSRRDVERTEIVAPFTAGVRDARVEVGAVVAAGSTVAELFASDELEVSLSLSLNDLGYLDRDESGMPRGGVVLKGRIGGIWHEWPATPARLNPEIERRTLSGNLVVKVRPKPGAEFPLPPVGLFVEAELSGKTLKEVVEIPRRALLDGNKLLIIDAENRIEIRDVEIVRSTEDSVIIASGLRADERICLTRLSGVVIGMEVKVTTEESDE